MSTAAATTMVLVLGLSAEAPIDIGSRLEMMVDDYLIDTMEGQARLCLHRPTAREVAVVHDALWEGNSCGYHVVFQDGNRYRMYYRGFEQTLKGEPSRKTMVACYAESTDGIQWRKPNLGLIEYEGSAANNIIWIGTAAHDFTVFKDACPECAPEAQYKAVAHGEDGLCAFQSADGIHWSRMNDGKAIITKGAFDSENLAFWDSVRGEYRAYVRDFRDGVRDIRTATSQDFIHWGDPEWLEYPGASKEQLYTNQVIPYYRAPHIFVGFPTRYTDHGWGASTEALPELEHRRLRYDTSPREGTALTDGLFMTSRDGRTFKRWGEAFIRPGLRTKGNWVYGDNYQAWGMITTQSSIDGAPDELSVYATESYWTGHSCQLRRYTLRVDGFVSVNAPLDGGEFVTKPLVFDGKWLVLNFSTSAAGSIRIEIRDAAGNPIDGYTLADAPEIFGDALDLRTPWKQGNDLATLAGRPVRLRFVLRDADLYSFQFQE